MMSLRQPGSSPRRSLAALWLLCALAFPFASLAQTNVQKDSVAPSAPTTKPEAPKMPVVEGTELDQVVAIVNNDLILDSDVDEEHRFEALQPYRDSSAVFSRDQAIERLINRDLILQQARLQLEDAITDDEVNKDLDSLRKTIPACKRYACETKAGWDRFLGDNGFTEASLMERWRERMEVLRFIEERFKMGIKIPAADIKSYYDKTLVPEFARQRSTPPKLEAVSDRIEEVLLQQQVSNLLKDWLKSLRAQGSVVVLHPGEAAP